MKYFFILSLGRTGTKFLSNMLNTVPEFKVNHEPFESDKQLLIYAYLPEIFGKTHNQMLMKRFNDLDDLYNGNNVYGEVNSYLRYSSNWLEDNLKAKTIYVARNGHDYIRSAYGRTLYTNYEPQFNIVPKDDDPFSKEWIFKSRFEKICWYWASTNEYLYRISGGNVLLFEKLLSDFDYFSEHILMPLNIKSINKKDWDNFVSKPKNSSFYYLLKERIKKLTGLKKRKFDTIPDINNWTDEMKSSFNEICGPTMLKLGYDL